MCEKCALVRCAARASGLRRQCYADKSCTSWMVTIWGGKRLRFLRVHSLGPSSRTHWAGASETEIQNSGAWRGRSGSTGSPDSWPPAHSSAAGIRLGVQLAPECVRVWVRNVMSCHPSLSNPIKEQAIDQHQFQSLRVAITWMDPSGSAREWKRWTGELPGKNWDILWSNTGFKIQPRRCFISRCQRVIKRSVLTPVDKVEGLIRAQQPGPNC